MVYSQEQKASEDSSFLKEDYQKLAYAEEEELLKLFWENKKAAEKIFNEKLYDRSRWVLVGKISISDLTDTLVKELKLVSCRVIRCYHRLITTHNNTSLVTTK
jgi:actin-related protein